MNDRNRDEFPVVQIETSQPRIRRELSITAVAQRCDFNQVGVGYIPLVVENPLREGVSGAWLAGAACLAEVLVQNFVICVECNSFAPADLRQTFNASEDALRRRVSRQRFAT